LAASPFERPQGLHRDGKHAQPERCAAALDSAVPGARGEGSSAGAQCLSRKTVITSRPVTRRD
jgi:hypothetical protein